MYIKLRSSRGPRYLQLQRTPKNTAVASFKKETGDGL